MVILVNITLNVLLLKCLWSDLFTGRLKTEIPCILASYQTWICLLIYCFYSHKCTISHISENVKSLSEGIFKILVTFEPVPEYMFNISNFKTYFLVIIKNCVEVNVILILYFFI
uniref:Secreted protein n=1 Tax=Heterorhabditis bacteriophora TaxID=37862 RepID=A0A1I7WET7_HETBA